MHRGAGLASHLLAAMDRAAQETGISVYRRPGVDDEKAYLYYDPLDQSPVAGRERWTDPHRHADIVEEALEAGRLQALEPAAAV